MSRRSFFSGVAVGAGLMWLLDRERDRVRSAGRGGRGSLRTRAGDIAGLGAHASRRPASGRGMVPGAAFTSAAGGALALYGLTRRGVTGRAMRAAGTSLLAAGLGKIEAGTGIERRRAIDVQQTIDVAAPPDRAFAFWSDVANFPRFMPAVQSVRDLGDGRSRWAVEASGGTSVGWITAVSALVPGRLVAWASEPGSAVSQVGAVRVSPHGGGSRIAVRLCYAPQGPAGDAAITALLGTDPLESIQRVFGRAKALLDQETTGRDARP